MQEELDYTKLREMITLANGPLPRRCVGYYINISCEENTH